MHKLMSLSRSNPTGAWISLDNIIQVKLKHNNLSLSVSFLMQIHMKIER